MKHLYHDTREYVDTDTKFSLIPDGKYLAMITEAKEMSSQYGNPYIGLTIEILEGVYRNRKIFDNLNVNSENETALAIARRKINDITLAVDAVILKGPETFLHKPIGITIGIDKNGRNQIKRYLNPKSVNTISTSAAPVKEQYTNSSDSIPF